MNLHCRVNRGKTLRVREQVNPAGELRPLKFRRAGEFRDIPLPEYVSEAADKHVADHGATPDGYLFQGRKHKLVVRRSYQQDFRRAAAKAGLPPQFIPHSLRHLYASTSLEESRSPRSLARPQQHRDHPPDLRPPHPVVLRPHPRGPRSGLPGKPPRPGTAEPRELRPSDNRA